MSAEKSDNLPVFAVVGKVNMGKTSVLSTLLEQDNNDVLRVSPTPGETTRNHVHGLKIGGEEVIQFIDTPGFSRPIDAMREIQRFHDGEGAPGRAAIRHFITHYKEIGEFEDEIQLLSPLIEGVGIIYIVDTSREMRDTYIAEMEILRWTGCHRLAVINQQEKADEGDWRAKLGSYFNLVRTFNAHHARYEERHSLLKSLLEIDELNSRRISHVIQLIQSEWDSRQGQSAESILEFLQNSLMHSASDEVTVREVENEELKQRKIEDLKHEYFDDIKKLQMKCFDKLLEIYKHKHIKAAGDLSIFEGVDIEAEETWTKWGLSRNQLTLAGGITGATAGGAVDVSTLGATHGLGALIGGLFGATATYLKGGLLPNLSISWDEITGNSSNQSNERQA